jgi:hypothetical protein
MRFNLGGESNELHDLYQALTTRRFVEYLHNPQGIWWQ